MVIKIILSTIMPILHSENQPNLRNLRYIVKDIKYSLKTRGDALYIKWYPVVDDFKITKSKRDFLAWLWTCTPLIIQDGPAHVFFKDGFQLLAVYRKIIYVTAIYSVVK